MRISALFLDYDGTIAPLDATREESAVPRSLYSVLEKISAKIPVAMITAKDLAFIRPRTGFAWAWSTAMGLETTLRDGTGQRTEVKGSLTEVIHGLRGSLPAGIIVEKKWGSDGKLLGVSLDWSKMKAIPTEGLEVAQKAFDEGGFQLVSDEVSRFMDVYAAPSDKGSALNTLVELLGVAGPVMYIGDSPADNAAFVLADVSIGVEHGIKDNRLKCQYSIRYDEVEGMLSSLLENGFEFTVPSAVTRGR